MPVTNWNQTVIDGKEYLVIEVAQLRVPLEWDPSSNVFIAVAAPTGGALDYPALVQGDDGETPDIDNTINFTALDFDDPDAESASWTETSPNVYRLNLSLRNGAPGEDGTMVLDPDDYGTPVAGKMFVVKSDLTGFEYQTQKVGDRYFPATINDTPTGNPGYTLAVVGIGPLDFDWRPEPHATCKVTGTSSDVRVDLLARLNGETGGNRVGRAIGGTGVSPATHVMIPALPSGSPDEYDKVLAGATATVHLRAERVTGTGTFSTSNTDTEFWVKVNPVP